MIKSSSFPAQYPHGRHGIGGATPPTTESSAACWTYDACGDAWTESPAMESARSYAAVAYDAEGAPFVTGGADGGQVTNTAEIIGAGSVWSPFQNVRELPDMMSAKIIDF